MRSLLVAVPGLLAIILLGWIVFAPNQPGPTAQERGATKGSETGLPIPRFVTLRADEVNMRTGPGTRYPIDWTYVRRNLPVEVVAEFDKWRKIRDFEGTEGWVHQSMLSGRRSILVIGQVRTMRRDARDSATPVARLEPGVIAQLDGCQEEWCEIEVAGLGGWIRRGHVWGALDTDGGN